MRYFLIAGEASGDLHAANLMRALKEKDATAEFFFYGGDRMAAVGGECLCHYRSIAYMGFISVLLHLRTILKAMKACKKSIVETHPDVVILVDYPGFNLLMAKFVKEHTSIPVYYYILPKVWAWKERRVERIKAWVDERFSILPFEIPFFETKHNCPIHYIGNPSVDEICEYQRTHPTDRVSFLRMNGLADNPIIALLPGSRVQEIKDNFSRMVMASLPYMERGYQLIVAGVPEISDYDYRKYLEKAGVVVPDKNFSILKEQTFAILQNAEVALVTSGTATLETALFNVPQVVCYYVPFGKLIRKIKPYFLKVKYISLVNLMLDREIVRELIGDEVNGDMIRGELSHILSGGDKRAEMLSGYEEMIERFGASGAPQHAAELMLKLLDIKEGSQR